MKQLLSTCKAMGVAVDGRPAEEVMKELDGGRYAEIINKFEKSW